MWQIRPLWPSLPPDRAVRPAGVPGFCAALQQCADQRRAGDPSAAEVGRVGQLVCWGLVPNWARDTTIGAKLNNARAEMVAVNRAGVEGEELIAKINRSG